MIYASIVLNYSMNFDIFPSESCLLDSSADCMIMNCSSDLFYVLFFPFGILNVEVWIEVSQKYSIGYDLVLYEADER